MQKILCASEPTVTLIYYQWILVNSYLNCYKKTVLPT